MPQIVTVTAPKDSAPGMKLLVATPDGEQFQCTIPEGVSPGQSFQVPINSPAAATDSSGASNAESQVEANARRASSAKQLRQINSSSRTFSCLLSIFGFCVALLSFLLVNNVSRYYDVFVGPCKRCDAGGCWVSTCRYINDWVKTQPITVDALPYRNASGNTTEENGDGYPDNWSLIVACVCGTTGGLLAMCYNSPVVRYVGRRGGRMAPLLIGCVVLSFLLLVASIVCLSVQMIANKHQWVFNAFCGNEGAVCSDQYAQITGSLAQYWVNDPNYEWYGQLVYIVFALTIILAFFELLFLIAVPELIQAGAADSVNK